MNTCITMGIKNMILNITYRFFFIHGTLDVEPPTKLWGLANSIRTTIERRQKTRGCFLSALNDALLLLPSLF